MQIEQVPQDTENFYDGHQRALYAKKKDGTYVQAMSQGWEVETYFTAQALEAVAKEYQNVLVEVRRGNLSPLAAHMAFKQMTPRLLAEHAGFFTFQVKRHLRPAVFAKLSEKKLVRYANCLKISLQALKEIP